MARQAWRGNVRELKNFIYRMALLAREDIVDSAALAPMLDQVQRAHADPGEAGGLDLAVGRWLAETTKRRKTTGTGICVSANRLDLDISDP